MNCKLRGGKAGYTIGTPVSKKNFHCLAYMWWHVSTHGGSMMAGKRARSGPPGNLDVRMPFADELKHALAKAEGKGA